MLKMSLKMRFERNCHPYEAWYVRVYNQLPDLLRYWNVEATRVGTDCINFVRFTHHPKQKG